MRTQTRRPWTLRDWALLSLMLSAALWILRRPLLHIIEIGARDDEQSHVFLAPFVAIWLLWLRRSRLRTLHVRPSFIGTLVTLAGLAMSWWGFQTDTQLAWHGGAIVAIIGVVISAVGLDPLRQFAPSFAALAFFLPVPGLIRQRIAIPLQEVATSVAHASLELFGVAARKMGNVLIINGEQIAVGEACNGMRLVFALTLVVFAFAFSAPLKTGVRLLLIALSPVVAVLCNVVRLVPTSLFYGYGTPGAAEQFHDALGWLMLPAALLILVGVLRLIRWLELPVTPFRLATQ